MSMAYTVEGTDLGVFGNAQYIGQMKVAMSGKSQSEQLNNLQILANTAIHDIHKANKRPSVASSRLHVTSTGIWIYQQDKASDAPALKWGASAREIYCVIMGRRKTLSSKQLACIMHVPPGTKVAVPFEMQAIVVEFHHDKKKEALAFHKATETMMNGLLYEEMAKVAISDAATDTAPPASKRRGSINMLSGAGDVSENGESAPGYMEIPDSLFTTTDDSNPGYMDLPDNMFGGQNARESIDVSHEGGGDYLVVMVRPTVSEGVVGIPIEDDDDIPE